MTRFSPRTQDDDLRTPDPGEGDAHPARDDTADPETDAIGYGRPPRGSRFAPGRSGNPNGRPRKDQAFKALLERELAERVPVKEGGRRRKLSKRGVIVKRLVSEAMAGSPRHLALVLAQDPVAAAVLGEVTAALSRPADDSVKFALVERLRAAVTLADAQHRSGDGGDGEEPNPGRDPDPARLPQDPDA